MKITISYVIGFLYLVFTNTKYDDIYITYMIYKIHIHVQKFTQLSFIARNKSTYKNFDKFKNYFKADPKFKKRRLIVIYR